MANLPELFRSPSFPRDFRRMQRQMDRLFDDLGGDMWREPAPLTGPAFTPSCDIEETDRQYLMNFDLPGVKKEDIKIELQDRVLTVSGERKEEKKDEKKNRYQSERFYGSFSRSFTLPEQVKAEQVEAHYKDGVLQLVVPKPQASKATQIKIGDRPTQNLM